MSSPDVSWEARMSAKHKAQHKEESGVTFIVIGYGAIKGDDGWNKYLRWVDEHWAARIAFFRETMTLDEARRILSETGWACACVGRPWCCRASYDVAKEVVYAASVVAHFLDARVRNNHE